MKEILKAVVFILVIAIVAYLLFYNWILFIDHKFVFSEKNYIKSFEYLYYTLWSIFSVGSPGLFVAVMMGLIQLYCELDVKKNE